MRDTTGYRERGDMWLVSEMEMGWERDTFACEVRGGEGEMNEMRVQRTLRVVSEGNEGDMKMYGVFVAGEDGKAFGYEEDMRLHVKKE